VLPREDPRDAVVLPAPGGAPIAGVDELVGRLGQCPRIGTSSVRRVAQLSRLFSCARFGPIRGNLDTRLRKLDGGDHDALVLAAAGLRRLGFADRIAFALPASACVPAPGQGIVAVEIRADDGEALTLISSINDPEAAAALAAERALVTALGGGCQTPIGALAVPRSRERIELVAAVVAVDGTRAVRASGIGPASEPEALGFRIADQLLVEGASDILADTRRVHGAVEGIQP
jgi:hydroxymethylbilane synthase